MGKVSDLLKKLAGIGMFVLGVIMFISGMALIFNPEYYVQGLIIVFIGGMVAVIGVGLATEKL